MRWEEHRDPGVSTYPGASLFLSTMPNKSAPNVSLSPSLRGDKHAGRPLVIPRDVTYPLLSRLGDVPVGFEKRANVDGLAAPEVSVNSPVEGKLQGAPVEGAAGEGGPISN